MYIPVGPDLKWGPVQGDASVGGQDAESFFVNWYTNFEVLENKYTKIDLSCTAMPIKNVTLGIFWWPKFFDGLRLPNGKSCPAHGEAVENL